MDHLDVEQPAEDVTAPLDTLPPVRPLDRLGVPVPPVAEPYQATAVDCMRVVGIVALVTVAGGMHEMFAARTGLPISGVWALLANAALAAAAASGRILTGRCVGFVPTLIICCTGGIALATLAYEAGEIVAKLLH